MGRLIEQEAALFKEWEKSVPGFSRDGVIDEEQYRKSKPKVMLILKEVNNKHGNAVDLKTFLLEGARERRPTWDNVARWLYGIRHLDQNITWKELSEREELNQWRKELLPTLCVMNLKKSPGRHTTNKKELIASAEQDKRYLNQQFELYFQDKETRPDIIITCGTGRTFTKLVNLPNKEKLQHTSRGIPFIKYDESGILIKFVHPEARVPDHFIYYALIDAIKEIGA